MRKFTKILKKKITKIGILSLITISSFLVFNTSKVKAEEVICDSDEMCLSYNHFSEQIVNDYLNSYSLKKQIENLRNVFINQDKYKYYLIVLKNNATPTRNHIYLYMFNDESAYINNEYDTSYKSYVLKLYVNKLSYYHYDNTYNDNGTYTFDDTYTDWIDKTTIQIIAPVSLKKGVDFNKVNTYNPVFILYETNFENLTLKGTSIHYLDNDTVIKSGDKFPVYSATKKPELEFDSKPVYAVINNKLYLRQVNLTINMKDYNENYVFVYKIGENSDWVTVNSSTTTLNIKKNVNVIAKIIDKNTGQDVTDPVTYQISNIENVSSEPTINDFDIKFSDYKNYRVDKRNNVETRHLTSVDLTIKYTVPYDKNYKLGYSLDNGNNFIFFNNSTISLTNNVITLRIEENKNIIAVITDENGTIIKSSTYSVTSIDDFPRITFKQEKSSNYDGTIYINYNNINLDKYIYQYKKTWESDNWITLIEGGFESDMHFFSYHLYSEGSYTIVARVLNKDDNSIFTSSSYTFVIIDDGNASFKDNVNHSFKYFSTPFQEIFKMFSIIWDGLPSPLKFLFIFIFFMLIALFIFKFIL